MVGRWWTLLVLVPPMALGAISGTPPGERFWGVVVGVSEYEHLDSSLALEGPRQDVPLVVTWLRRQGVPRRHLTVLADQVKQADGLPTRAAILRALDALPQRMRAGDIAFLYFAGHGSQQPQGEREWSKADGFDEIFLPRDVGRWDSASGRVEGAIVDYEIGRAVDALRDRGIFVWLVFDSCHSATMARALLVPHVRLRAVPAAELGVPNPASSAAKDSVTARIVKVSATPRAAGYVAFYAAQTVDSAPEMPLPPGERGRQVHGLFTYALLKALATAGGSYRQVAHRILALYASTYPATTPQFEGALDTAIGAPSAPLVPPTDWPAHQTGKTFRIDAGRLNGITPQSTLALYAALPDSSAGAPLRLLRVDTATLTDAWAKAIDDPRELKSFGITAKRGAEVASGVVRVLETGVDTLVRIAGPASCFASLPAPVGCNATAAAATATGALEAARHMTGTPGILPAGSALTTDIDAADLFLVVRDGRLVVVQSAAPALDQAAGVDLAAKTAADDLRLILYRANRTVALARLAAEYPAKPAALVAALRARSPDGTWREIDGARQAVVPFGTELSIQLQNTGSEDLDVTILALDDRFGIVPVYPVDGESNLLRQGSARLDISGWARTPGENKLVFIIENARAGRSDDLGFLSQPGLARHGRGAGFGDLLERIGFSAGDTRCAVSSQTLQAAAMKILRYNVSPGS